MVFGMNPNHIYLAGVFDAKVRFRYDERRGCELRVPSDDLDLLMTLKELCGGRVERNGGSRRWVTTSAKHIHELLTVAQPYMHTKRNEIQKVIDWTDPVARADRRRLARRDSSS